MMETIRKKYTLGKAGFSLAELMIVMAMVAVLAAIATPSILRGLPEKRLKNAARNLYADLQKARLLAVKENRTVTVRFIDNSGDQDFYYFDTDNDGAFTAGEFTRNLSEHGGIAYGSGSAGDGNGGGECRWDKKDCTQATTLSFTYSGVLSNSFGGDKFGGTVYLQNQNDNICYALSVSAYGNVRIRKFDGTGWDKK